MVYTDPWAVLLSELDVRTLLQILATLLILIAAVLAVGAPIFGIPLLLTVFLIAALMRMIWRTH